MTSAQAKSKVQELVANEYSETHVGYHANYRQWNGEFKRGCYAQVAAPYGGTIRIYASSYAQLLDNVEMAKEAGQF